MSLAEELLADLDDIEDANDELAAGDDNIMDAAEQLEELARKMDGSIHSIAKLNASDEVGMGLNGLFR